MSRNRYRALIIVFLLIPVVFFPWRGFYMLNDDYIYIWNAQNYFNNGFVMHPLTSPTLILQTLLGSITYKIVSDVSFLRLTSYFFYLGSTVFVFLYAKSFNFKESTLAAITVLYAFNPLVLYLGFSYMSESFFLFFFVGSVYFFTQYCQKTSEKYLILTVVFIALSILQRQTGLILLFAFLINFYILKIKFTKRVFLYFLIPILTYIFVEVFLPKTLAYTDQSLLLTVSKFSDPNYLSEVLFRFLKSLYYVGYFTWPITTSIFIYMVVKKRFSEVFNLTFIIAFIIFSSLSIFFWFYEKSLMFYIPNILSYAGINPQNLGFGIKQTFFVDSPVRIKAFITLLSCFSVSYLSYLVIKLHERIHKNILILLVPSALILVASLVFRDFFDRYLVVMVPLLVIVAGMLYENSKVRVLAFLAFFVFIYSLVSFAMVHDYLSFNKSVWELSLFLGGDLKSVRSTFEFNNYWYLDEVKNSDDVGYLFNREYLPKNQEYSYIISYIPLDPYCVNKNINYRSFISPSFNGRYVVLEPCK